MLIVAEPPSKDLVRLTIPWADASATGLGGARVVRRVRLPSGLNVREGKPWAVAADGDLRGSIGVGDVI